MNERMRILAIDDNAANLTTIEQELQEYYDVVTILTGRRAIKYLMQESVDLILLDVSMPIMDGIETLREIRTLGNGATIPVIFLTALKDKNTVIEGARLGIMDYITKPFDAIDLRSRIEQVFMRLGKQEIPSDLLLQTVSETLDAMNGARDRTALAKLEEMQGYVTTEEIHERIRHAKIKYADGDSETAKRMLTRLKLLLKKESDTTEQAEQLPISREEIHTTLVGALHDLENFYVKNACEKLRQLDNYKLPEDIRIAVNNIANLLDDFDDESGEKALRNLLVAMKNS